MFVQYPSARFPATHGNCPRVVSYEILRPLSPSPGLCLSFTTKSHPSSFSSSSTMRKVSRIQSDDYLQSWRHYLADPRMTSGGAGRIRSARYFHYRATCYWWFGQRPWADTSNIVGTCLSNVGIRRRCIPVRTWKCSSAFRWSIFGVAAISEPSSIARSQTVKNNLDGSGYDLKYGRPRCALS